MRYENQHLDPWFGKILNGDGTKAVSVFCVLSTAEAYAGSSRYPAQMPDELIVKEFDFRGKDRSQKIDEPRWVKREGATLKPEDGRSYRLRWDVSVGWRISPFPDSSREQNGA